MDKINNPWFSGKPKQHMKIKYWVTGKNVLASKFMLPFTENVRCARHYSKSFARSSSHKHFKVGIIIIPILEMRKFAQYYVSIK